MCAYEANSNIYMYIYTFFFLEFYPMQLMMIAWHVLILVTLQTLYAFGLGSTLMYLVPQINYVLCKSLSFNQIYVIPLTLLNVSLSLNSEKRQMNYSLSLEFSFSLYHPQASSSFYPDPSIISALKEVRTSFLMGFWDSWNLGAVPNFPSWPTSRWFLES